YPKIAENPRTARATTADRDGAMVGCLQPADLQGKMRIACSLGEGRLLFRSRDVDETRAFLDPFGERLDPIGSDRGLAARFNGEFLCGLYIGYVQFGASALVRADSESTYVAMPLRGRFEAASHNEVVSCATQQGVVLSPTRENIMRSESGSTRLGIAVKR